LPNQAFADRNSNTTKSNERLNIKQGFLTRLSVGNRSWHSYRCNENPTLRSYTKKVEGEDHSLSLLSEEVNVSFASEASENNNMNRSFCAFNSSHRPLDTVHEENESQESAMIGSEAVVGSNVISSSTYLFVVYILRACFCCGVDVSQSSYTSCN
ncbi:hypothetical protein COOONC_02734, partial [Cooperia oncophora]